MPRFAKSFSIWKTLRIWEKRMPVEWTPEKLSSLSMDALKSLRENCLRKGAQSIAAACDTELLKRAPAKRPGGGSRKNGRKGEAVVGYHFVCRPEEKGVIRNSDGTAWSGTWVVAADQAEKSLKADGYVALHLRHSEPSYLQGKIKAWRRSKRERAYAEGQEVKTPMGPDFLLQITEQPMEWRGEGTMERSYVYTSDVEKT
jgi:hypothetical protein